MKIIYWITTSFLSLFLTWSAYTYLFSKATIEGVRELGFPDHFRVQLAVLKILAVLVIMIPQIPIVIKHYAYAGIGCFFITAIVAHAAHKDPIFINLINLFLLIVMGVSCYYLTKIG